MKNKFLIIFFFFIFFTTSHGEELKVNSSKIKIDNEKNILYLNKDVKVVDYKNNQFLTDAAIYNKKLDFFETKSETKFISSDGYQTIGKNISYDKKKGIISSLEESKLIDPDGNELFLNNFTYSVEKNIFKSSGKIKFLDNKGNNYFFSQIYVDTQKKKMVGSDVKMFLNQDDFKIDKRNDPRFFANTLNMTNKKKEFQKGIFTYCKLKNNDDCPPWTLQAEKIKHDEATKTIYYDNAVLKIYDFPIFYFPKFYHPDPSVKRRSGLLTPSINNTKNLGFGIEVPYFWSIAEDKDITFTPKLYNRENPLLLTEYRQDFKKSFLILYTGHTTGYRKENVNKTSGSRNHFFGKFNIDLYNEKNSNGDIEFNVQKVSNNTYLKAHNVNTTLVSEDTKILENNFLFNYNKDDLFFYYNMTAFEDLSVIGRSKYEYLLPHAILEKNIIANNKFGILDFDTNVKISNYDVSSQTEFLVNNFNWKSPKWINKLGVENQIHGMFKNTNYNANDTEEFKNKKSNVEGAAALGFLTELPLKKFNKNKSENYFLTPKILIRYSPTHMRNVNSGRLSYNNLFDINKVNEIDVIENGLSMSLGFNYSASKVNAKKKTELEKFSFSMGQVVSDGENADMPSSTSLDQKFSDVVGVSTVNIGENSNFNYNFSIDQNYKDFNYNEIGVDYKFNDSKFKIDYLQEKNHIGNNEFAKVNFDFAVSDSTEFNFGTKRNLLTNSAEFYNLSYTYLNDCLKAGLVFRREFYSDKDIEPEESLMFKISIVPFADIKSPKVFN